MTTSAMVNLFGLGISWPAILSSSTFWAYVFWVLWYDFPVYYLSFVSPTSPGFTHIVLLTVPQDP